MSRETETGAPEPAQLLGRIHALFGAEIGWWLMHRGVVLSDASALDCLGTLEGRQHLTRLEHGAHV